MTAEAIITCRNLCFPFAVVMVREIAQHVGSETIYTVAPYSLLTIAEEEGWPGLFAGLAPTLVYSVSFQWANAGVKFLLERFLFNHGAHAKQSRSSSEMVQPLHAQRAPRSTLKRTLQTALCAWAAERLVARCFAQAFHNVSRMMCVAGTE